MAKIRQAIMLVGGKGERLRPLTNNRPKAMLEIAGKPLVAYQLSRIVRAGIKKVTFACSHHAETLMEHVGAGERYGIQATYSVEEVPLGRGGGTKLAMEKLSPGWEDVLVINGDTLWNFDLNELIETHKKNQALATVVVVPFKSPYGIIDVAAGGAVLAFNEKPVLPYWVNTGIYVFSRKIKSLLPEKGDTEVELLQKLSPQQFHAFMTCDYWRGIDTIKDLNEVANDVKNLLVS